MIQNIVFDIGQVLANFRWQEYINDFHYDSETTRKLMHATAEDETHWIKLDHGILSDEEFFLESVKREPTIEKELRLFFQSMGDMVVEYPYAKPLISQLKENGYHIYLLSNYGKTPFTHARDRFSFLPLVHGGIISYSVKQVKPHPAIYHTLLQTYKLKPSATVFVDDRAQNIETAKKLGLHTVLFESLPQLLEELHLLHVNIENCPTQ